MTGYTCPVTFAVNGLLHGGGDLGPVDLNSIIIIPEPTAALFAILGGLAIAIGWSRKEQFN